MPAVGRTALIGSPAIDLDDEEERRKWRFLPSWDGGQMGADLSSGFNSIIRNENLMWGVGVGVIGWGAKMALNASGAWAVTLGIAAVTGVINGTRKAAQEYDGNGWKFARTVLTSTALSTAGSMFSFFALDGIFEGIKSIAENFNLFGAAEVASLSAPTEVAAPVEQSLPAVSSPPVEDIVTETVVEPETPAVPEAPAISQQWQDIQAAAEAGNPQAQKDMAMALFNGSHGFEVDTDRALELYTAAAEAGNVQAKVDLAYLQYHGLTGVSANPQEAIEAMRGLAGSDARAADFIAAWDPQPPAVDNVTTISPLPLDGADPIGFTPSAGDPLSMQFHVEADGEIRGIIHNAAGRVAPGTVFLVPVAQVS